MPQHRVSPTNHSLSPVIDHLSPGDWYVIHSQPQKEQVAATALQKQCGLSVYLPEVTRYYQGQVQHAPLFPRYLFIKADLQQIALSQINTTLGVMCVVRFGEIPQPIPSTIIQAIQQQVQRLNAGGGLSEVGFQPGDAVHIKAGPLRGLDAVFDGPVTPSERVQILLEFMGRLNEVQVERSMLTAHGSEPPVKQPRQTRGRGRWIRQGAGSKDL